MSGADGPRLPKDRSAPPSHQLSSNLRRNAFGRRGPLGLGALRPRAAPTQARIIYVPMEPYRRKIGVNEARRQQFRRLERRYMSRVAAAIFMGESIRADYVSAYGGPEDSHVIYDSWLLALTAQPKDLRRSGGIPGDPVVVLYCGQIEIPRGVTGLVLGDGANARIFPIDSSWLWHRRRGNTPARPPSRRQRPGRFCSAGAAKDLVGLMADADVGVIPSRGEMSLGFGCPGKMFTYMAAGLPLVVSDCPDTRNLVRTHGFGRSLPARGRCGPFARAQCADRLGRLPQSVRAKRAPLSREDILLGIAVRQTGANHPAMTPRLDFSSAFARELCIVCRHENS